MILSSMNLPYHSADSRTIVANYHEEVFGGEADFFVHVHDLHVRKPLLVRANFILAFHDQDAVRHQDAVRLQAAILVQVENRLVILACCLSPASVVAVMVLEWCVNRVGCATG